ncbi:MAG: hypothetical protein FRX48_03756 [Lasallia pustulata]|uniref:CCHC-type domain-containing protein n=1 Tax=Lasallia pustulata TaxID=136370 RepID=A0A5M8PTM5_9LECA|nr:MAG: hypothetical protein FRX48_03756 [Lasallia pustulata]
MSSSPSGDRGHGRGRGGRTCHRCGGEGHIARYCRQKVDIRRPSRTELGSGGDESVDPTKSSEPLAARGRGESKYYKGEDPDPEPSPQKEAPKPSPHEPSLPAPETLNRDQPTAAEPSTNPSETPSGTPPGAVAPPKRRRRRRRPRHARRRAAARAAPPYASDPYLHVQRPASTARRPPSGAGTCARLEPQPRGNTGTAVEAPAASGQHTGADIGPWVGESGEQGWVRFPVMVRTLIELGDRRVVVFVWPKEGQRIKSMTMTGPPPAAPTVDDLKKHLDPILAKIRALRAEIEAVEERNRQRATGPSVGNGQQGSRWGEDGTVLCDLQHEIPHLKLRILYLRKFEKKLNRQISVLMGERFPDVDEFADLSGEEEDAVAGRKAPLEDSVGLGGWEGVIERRCWLKGLDEDGLNRLSMKR